MEQRQVMALPARTVLEGRYVLGESQRRTAGGIVYAAFDKKLRIMVEILEYIPSDCDMKRDGSGISGDAHFMEKKEKILSDGLRRMHSAQSDIYDVLPSGGTVYLVQVSPKNNGIPQEEAPPTPAPVTVHNTAPAEMESPVSETTPAPSAVDENTHIGELASRTRIVEGLFPTEETPVVTEGVGETEERPVLPVAESWTDTGSLHTDNMDTATETTDETLPPEPDTPSLVEKPKKEKHVPKSSEGETDEMPPTDAGATTGGPSVRLLLGILAAGVILLLICTAVFLTSLFRMTELPGGTDSLLGVPYTEIAQLVEENWLVVGRANHDGYAPGTVAAEEVSEGRDGSLFRVLINGHTPTYTMPSLTGMTAEGAKSLLAKTAFDNSHGYVRAQVTVEWQKTADAPHGAVIAQNPAAGTVTKSSLVTLTLAENTASFGTGTTTAPSLVGKMLADVTDVPLLVTDQMYSDSPAGEILSQLPMAGESWAKNAPYLVAVSLGPAMTRMPDVQFTSLADAEKALYGCGLSFTVTYEMDGHVQTGLVSHQSPAVGEILAWGDTVSITVSGEGTYDTGPAMETELTDLVLTPGDTWSLSLGDALTPVYHTSAPEIVSVTDGGLVTALSPGSAMLTASVGGQTLVVALEVVQPDKPVYAVSATVGEKLSLPALGSGEEAGMTWYTDPAFAEVDSLGNLTGKKAGTAPVWGIRGNTVSLYTVKLEKAESEKVYHTIAKSLAQDRQKLEKALKAKGLTCEIVEEYSDKTKGSVMQVKYSGYSDDKEYHIAEGSKVTLVISRGKPSVSSVSVEKMPTKVKYRVGEKISTAGLSLKVTYADKSTETVTSGFTVSYDFGTAGRKTVSVSYGQKKTSFAVDVTDSGPKSAEIVSKPTKTTYTVGEKLDTAGLKVKVTYKDGSTKSFTSGFTVSYDFSSAGTKKVTVTVEGLKATFNVTVKAASKPETTKPETTKPETKPAEKTLRSIRISTKPNQTKVARNGTVDTTGMVLTLTWSDGTTETVKKGWSISCDTSTLGTATVNVTYEGKKTSYNITVEEEPITAVHLGKKPRKLTYTVGEKIDLAGLELSVVKGGQMLAVGWPNEGISWECDTKTAGKKTLYVYYAGLTVEIDVTVEEVNMTALSVHSLPKKLSYDINEELDTTGLVLSAKFEDGATRRVTEGFRCFYDFGKAGEAKVVVTWNGGETSFTVTVVDPRETAPTYPDGEGSIRLSAESITLDVGESEELTIYYHGKNTMLSYELDRPHVVEATDSANGLKLTGTYPGTCVIRLSDGEEEAVCVVTVREKKTADVTVSMPVSQSGTMELMPILTFTGGKEDTEFSFTATIRFDPEKLMALDAGSLVDGVSVTLRDTDVIVITGTVDVPKNQDVAAAYVFFYGTDADAFTWEVK